MLKNVRENKGEWLMHACISSIGTVRAGVGWRKGKVRRRSLEEGRNGGEGRWIVADGGRSVGREG